jgi:GT2 family glycosyltransferase
MDLSILVVSYNTVNLLCKCLSSAYSNLPSNLEAEIIVVDNASRDGSAEMVQAEFPLARVIANAENRGFAAANNQGLQLAQGRYILLLNPDTEVLDNALEKLVKFLQDSPDVAVVSPALVYPDSSFQHSVFKFPNLWQIFLDFIPINWRFTESSFNGRYPRRYITGPDAAPFPVDFPLGACMLLRRDVIEQVGPMDERFWMYMEEIDWCFRIRKTVRPDGGKWQIYCQPAARIIHHSGASSRQFRHEMFYQLHYSRALFYKKHRSLKFRLAARGITWLGLGWLSLKTLRERLSGKIESGEFSSRLYGYRRVAGIRIV